MANLVQIQDEEEQPTLTRKGYSEIVSGTTDSSKSRVRFTAGGYGMPNYAKGAQAAERTPALIVEDEEMSGGMTTLNQALYSRTDEGLEQFNQARQTATRLQEAAQLPNSYRVSAKKNAVKNFLGDMTAKASETVVSTLSGFADGRYWNAIKEAGEEGAWKDAVGRAYAKDPALQDKMQNLYYRVDSKEGGALVSLADMSYDDLAYAKIDRWVNADGTPLSEDQISLLEKYKNLNTMRVNDREYRQYTQHFGQEMADRFGLHKTTQADFDTTAHMLASGAGDVLGSGLIYGYGGYALSRFVAAPAAIKLAPRVQALNRRKYISKALDKTVSKMGLNRIGAQEGISLSPSAVAQTQEFVGLEKGIASAAKKAYTSHLRMTIPMNTFLSGVNGSKFAFGTSFFRQYYDIRNEALMQGRTFNDANWAGTWAGLGEGLLEGVKFNAATKRFLSSDPNLWNFLVYEVVPEGLQEGSQQAWENMVTEATGLSDKEWRDIASEIILASAMGAIGGAAFGAIHYRTNTIQAAEEGIKDRYRRDKAKEQQGALDYDAWGNAAGEENTPSEENLKELPFNGMPGEQGFTMKSPTEQDSDWSEAVLNKGEKQTVESPDSDISGKQTLQLDFEEDITLPDGSKSKKSYAYNYKEDGEDDNGNARFATGELQDPVSGEVVGVKGVLVDPNTGKKVGDYTRYTKKVRPYQQNAQEAQEMASAEERVLQKAQKIFVARAKAVNPKITKEQLDRGWRAIRRAAQHELNTNDFSKSVFDAINKSVDSLTDTSERFRTNIIELQGRLGEGLSDKDIERLQSDDAMTRYEAQWDLIKRGITRMFAENGMAADGEKVANAFQAMFQDMLLIDSNLDPLDFYNAVKPQVLSFARAQANGQKVKGMHTLFDDVMNRVEQLTPQQGYDIAYNLLAEFDLYKNSGTEDERKKHEWNIKQTLFGNKAVDYKAEDIETAIMGRADIEEIAAWNMGLNIGNDFQFDKASYHVMAIMRSMGFDQNAINSVFGVKPREDANADYNLALNDATYDDDGDLILNAAAPKLSEQEIKDLEHLLRMANKESKADDTAPAKGLYDPNTNTIAIFNARQGTENNAGVGEEEGLHWVFNVARAVANSEVIIPKNIAEKASIANDAKYGSKYKISLDPHSGEMISVIDPEVHNPGIVLPIAMAQRLNNNIRGIIRARRGSKYNITPREVEETLIDAYNRWVKDSNSVPRGIATDLTAMTNIMNNQLSQPKTDSLLNKGVLPKTSEKGLKQGIQEAFKPGPVSKLMYAANDLNKAMNTAQTKDELGQAVLKALKENPEVPFELTTPLAVEQALKLPESEFPLYVMQDIAQRVKENMREQAIRLALEEASKGSSFNPEDTADADYTEGEMPILYSRDGKKIEQPALSNYDIKARNEATKKMFSWTSIKKAAKDVAESIAHAAREVSKELAAVIKATAYDHTLREFQNQLIVGKIWNLWYEHDKRAMAGKGGTVITEQKYQKFLDIIGTMGEGKDEHGNDRPTRADAIQWMREAFDYNAKESEDAAKALQALFKAFDNAYTALTARGVKLNAIKEYFPRHLVKRDKLAQLLAHPVPGSRMDIMIEKMKKEGENPIALINAINKQFRKNSGDTETEMFHHRVFKDVSGKEMWDCYENPFDTALEYLNSASRTMMMRDLFGDIQYDEIAKATLNGKKIEIKNPKLGYTGRVGTTLLALHEGKFGDYDPKALENFIMRMKELQARKGDDTENFWSTIKAMQGVFALGTPKSTLNQYLELVPTLYRYGLHDVAKAAQEILKDKNAVDIAKIALRPLNESERISEKQGWFSVAQKKILKWTGFEKADVFLKNIVVNAALIKAQRVILEDAVSEEEMKSFNKSFDETFPPSMITEEQRNKIKQDIAEGNITKEVGLFLRNELAKTQPLDSMEITAGYLGAGPLGKAMYYLSTTQLKQAEFFADDIIERAKEAPNKFESSRQVAKQLARLFIFGALVGIPVEALAAILIFKKPNPGRAAVYTPLQFLMMNEYMMSQVPKKGLASAALGQIAPGAKPIDALTTGRWFKLVPGVGESLDKLFGPGGDQMTRHGEHLLYDKTSAYKEDETFIDDLNFFGGDKF